MELWAWHLVNTDKFRSKFLTFFFLIPLWLTIQKTSLHTVNTPKNKQKTLLNEEIPKNNQSYAAGKEVRFIDKSQA